MDHSEKPFTRELRYVVFKLKDIHAYLSREQIDAMQLSGETIAAGRRISGIAPFNAVVVEQDWPEFDLAWEMIEARMTGEGNDCRRYRACANACEGIETDIIDAPGKGWIESSIKRVAERVRRADELENYQDELLAAVSEAVEMTGGAWVGLTYREQNQLRPMLNRWRAAIAKAKSFRNRNDPESLGRVLQKVSP